MGHETEGPRAWALGLLDGTTPGPWWENCDEVRAGDGDGTGDADEYDCVATCGLADARLIAAAPDLAAALLSALDRVAEVEAERDALARIVEAADPCVEALRDIAADAHAAWLDVYDAATLASVTCEVGDE